MPATNVSSARSPFWSIPAVQAPAGSCSMASISLSVHDQPTENSQVRPRTPPPAAMCSSRSWENPAPSSRTSSRRRYGPGRRETARSSSSMLPAAQLDAAPPGRGSIARTSSVLSQVARLGQNPVPPLQVGCAFSFPDAANTMDASRSTTVIPVSSRPATRSHGNPSGRLASTSHQCRRNPVTAALTRASCSSPASDSARHTAGVDASGPVTGARCRRPWKSLIASPPRISIRARSRNTWPRSCTGSNHRGRQPRPQPGPLGQQP
jgi:hypothetical protein